MKLNLQRFCAFIVFILIGLSFDGLAMNKTFEIGVGTMASRQGVITLPLINGNLIGDGVVRPPAGPILFDGVNGSAPPEFLLPLVGEFEQRDGQLFATGEEPPSTDIDPVNGTNGWVIAADAEVSEGSISVRVHPNGGIGAESGLAMRVVDNRNFIDCVLVPDVILVRVVDGAPQDTLAIAPIPDFDPNSTYLMRVDIVGNEYRVFIDGTLLYTVEESAFSDATMFGLKYGGTDVGFSELEFPIPV